MLCIYRMQLFVSVFRPPQMQNTMVQGTGAVVFTGVCNYTKMVLELPSKMYESQA